MTLDPVLASVAIGWLTEVECDALEDQEWFPYNYDEGKIRVLLAAQSLISSSAGGFDVRKGGQPEVNPKELRIVCLSWDVPAVCKANMASLLRRWYQCERYLYF